MCNGLNLKDIRKKIQTRIVPIPYYLTPPTRSPEGDRFYCGYYSLHKKKKQKD